jgi:hypothetical protein
VPWRLSGRGTKSHCGSTVRRRRHQHRNHISEFILDYSKTIVQDDAGIPISSFNPQKWNVCVFGTCVGPIAIFKQHYQPKLKEMFDQTLPPPIDFNFGYRWSYKESHVIVATRQ